MTPSGSVVGRLATLALCLVLVTALVPSTGVAETGASFDTDDESSLTDADIDDELLESEEPVEVVVRLEEATLPAARSDAATERLLEEHAADTQEPLLEYAAATPGIDVRESFWVTNAVLLEIETARVTLETLEGITAVESIHRNFDLPAPDPPEPDATNDTERKSETTDAIARLNVPAVWDEYETRGDGVRVAVLDTGIDASHPDLELYTDDPSDPTYPGGWAAFDENGDRIEGSTPHDSGTHGTHVSGTIGGGDASDTSIGIAPEAELIHGQVLSEEGGTFAQIVAGLEWALEADADVINLSLGSTGTYPELIEPVTHATESGVVVVAAIGNDGPETSDSPGNVYDAVSVGAVDDDDVASFSGGEHLDGSDWETTPEAWPAEYTVPTVVAPGVDITSTVPDGYARQPGTSMATPHVTGTMALLRSIAPDATPDELATAVTETAWKPDGQPREQDPRYGYGIVDTKAAADSIAETRAGADSSAHDSDTAAEAEPTSWSTVISTAAVVAGIGISVVVAVSWRRRR